MDIRMKKKAFPNPSPLFSNFLQLCVIDAQHVKQDPALLKAQ